MSTSDGNGYTKEKAEDRIDVLRAAKEEVKQAIETAADISVLDFLIHEQQIDIDHDGPQGIGEIRRAILKADNVSQRLKREVITRGDDTPRNILVPEDAQRNAKAALKVGKPVVLYGPTGTGKTTFAKQLALDESVGYSLNTATPSWTAKDIVGGIAPEVGPGSRSLRYHTELGCISKAVQRIRDFGVEYSVIIDEMTRADISQVFGPLYTAIENRNQTLIETDDGEAITLDEELNIICTMNMSDRTVNELDNAITRRFAMIEVDEYDESSRRELFEAWYDEHLDDIPLIEQHEIIELIETDYQGINYGGPDSSQGGIMRFGPMHYLDVFTFLGKTLDDESLYLDQEDVAVGQAYRVYIVPRLLNTAAFPQIEQIRDHYQALDEQFSQFDLTPAINLAQKQLEAEQRQMRSYE